MMSVPKKTDTLPSPTDGGPKNARQHFVIPKKLDHDGRREIDLHSREFQAELFPIIQQCYIFPDSVNKIVFNGGYHLHNSNLVSQFLKRKTELAACRAEKELAESYAFFGTRFDGMASGICKNGMNMGNIPSNVCNLGNSKMGITLQKNSDVLWYKETEKGLQHYMIIFKIIKGRIKFVPNNSSHLEPTPNYDCHMSKQTSIANKVDLPNTFRSTQIFMYQYSEDGVLVKPRQAYPVAVLFYHYDSAATISKNILPNLGSKPASKKEPFHTSGVSIWTGKIMNQGNVIGKASMISYSILFRPILFGKIVNLNQSLPFNQFRKRFLKNPQRITIRREMRSKTGFLLYTQLRAIQVVSFKELMAYLREKEQVAVWYAGKRVEGFIIPDRPCLRDLGFPSLSKPHAMCHCLFFAPYSMAGRLEAPKERLQMGQDSSNTSLQFCSSGLLGETPADTITNVANPTLLPITIKDVEEGFSVSTPPRSLMSYTALNGWFKTVLKEEYERERLAMFQELEAATQSLKTPRSSELQSDIYSSSYYPPQAPAISDAQHMQSAYDQSSNYGYPPTNYSGNIADPRKVKVQMVATDTITSRNMSASNIMMTMNRTGTNSVIDQSTNEHVQSHNIEIPMATINDHLNVNRQESTHDVQPELLKSNKKENIQKAGVKSSQIARQNMNKAIHIEQTKKGVNEQEKVNTHVGTGTMNKATKNEPCETSNNDNVVASVNQVHIENNNPNQSLQSDQLQASVNAPKVIKSTLRTIRLKKKPQNASKKQVVVKVIEEAQVPSVTQDLSQLDVEHMHSNNPDLSLVVQTDQVQTGKRVLNKETVSGDPKIKRDKIDVKTKISPTGQPVQPTSNLAPGAVIDKNAENVAVHRTSCSPNQASGQKSDETNIPYLFKPLEYHGKKRSLDNQSKELPHSMAPQEDSKSYLSNVHPEFRDSSTYVRSSRETTRNDDFFSKVGSNWESSLPRRETETIPFLNCSQEPQTPQARTSDVRHDNTELITEETKLLNEATGKNLPEQQIATSKVTGQPSAKTTVPVNAKGKASKLIAIDLADTESVPTRPKMKLSTIETSGSNVLHDKLNHAMQDAMKNFHRLQTDLMKNQMKLSKPVCDEIGVDDQQRISPGTKSDDKIRLRKLSSFSTIFNEMGNKRNKCEAIDELKEEVTKFTEGIMTKIASGSNSENSLSIESEKISPGMMTSKKRSLGDDEVGSFKKQRFFSEDKLEEHFKMQPTVKQVELNATDEIVCEEMDRFYDVFSMFLSTSSQPEEHAEFLHQKELGKLSLSKLRVIKEYGDSTDADRFINYTVKAGTKQFLFMLDKLLTLLEYFPFEEYEQDEQELKKCANVEKDLLYDKIVSVVSKLTKDLAASRGKQGRDKVSNAVLANRCFTMLNKICCPNPKIDDIVEHMTSEVGTKLDRVQEETGLGIKRNIGSSQRKTDSGSQNPNNPVLFPFKSPHSANQRVQQNAPEELGSRTTKEKAISRAPTLDLVSIPLPEECPRKSSLRPQVSTPDVNVGKLVNFIANQTSNAIEGLQVEIVQPIPKMPVERKPARELNEVKANGKSVPESKSMQHYFRVPKPTVGSRKVYKCKITKKRKLFLKKKKLHLERYYEYRKSLLHFIVMSKKVKKLAYTTAVCSKLRPKYQQIRRRHSSGKIYSSLRNVMLKVNDTIHHLCHNQEDFMHMINLHNFELSDLLKKLARDVHCRNVHASTMKSAHHMLISVKDSLTADKGNPWNAFHIGVSDSRSTRSDVPQTVSREHRIETLSSVIALKTDVG